MRRTPKAWRHLWTNRYYVLGVHVVTLLGLIALIVIGVRDDDPVRWVTGLVAIVPVTFRTLALSLIIARRDDDTGV